MRLQTDSIIFTSWRAAVLLTFRFLGVESGNEMLGGGVGEVSVCNSRCVDRLWGSCSYFNPFESQTSASLLVMSRDFYYIDLEQQFLYLHFS